MKNATATRSKRALSTQAPSSEASREGGSRQGAESAAAAQATAPDSVTKPVGIYEWYTARVAAIYGDTRTKPEDLFEPLSSHDDSRHVVIGTLKDPIAIEFFSLATELQEKSNCVPFPKNVRELNKRSEESAVIKQLSRSAMGLGWAHLHATMPEANITDSLAVCDGWLVIRKRKAEDELRERAAHMGMPLDQVDAHVARHMERSTEPARGFDPFEEDRPSRGGRSLKDLMSGSGDSLGFFDILLRNMPGSDES